MHRLSVYRYGLPIGILLSITIGFGGCPTTPGGSGSTFNLPPTPVITADVVRGVAPLTVQFNSDRSTDDGLIVSREWDFDDGSTSLEIAPRHTYTSNGDYTVTLKLTDDSGLQNTETTVITVTAAPIAVIQYSPTSAESAPATISFDGSASYDPDGEIVSYSWDFGDGSRETIPTLNHIFASAGTFRVRLTVTDDKGVTDVAERLIPIGIPLPTIEIRTPPPSVNNIVATPDSQLWIQAVYTVDTSASSFIRAGLDLDQDLCDAKTVLYDMNNGAAIFEFTGHDGLVNDVVFSPDGGYVVSASDDQTIRAYSTTTGGFVGSYDAGSEVKSVDFSPTGTRLALGLGDGDVRLVTFTSDGLNATFSLVRTMSQHTAAVTGVAFSAAGDQLVSGSEDRHAIVWNIADGTVLRDFEHNQIVNTVAFSPGRDDIIASGSTDGEIKIWNITSGTELFTLTGHDASVNNLTFSSDGLSLISGGNDDEIRIWNPFLGILVARYQGHDDDVTAVAISSDGSRIVSGSADFTVRTWDTILAAQRLEIQPCESTISSVAVSPDGSFFAAGIYAQNSIQLDTDPPNGNDLNITVPQGLLLENVASIDNADVPAGTYYLWAEIVTDKTDLPVRNYSPATVTITDTFPSNFNTQPPLIRTSDIDEAFEANILVNPDQARQIFDLGPLNAGDRVSLSLMHIPGYGVYYTPDQEYSIMMLDSTQKIFAWYSTLALDATSAALSEFLLFTQDTRLVVGHFSTHYYVVVDGGVGVKVEITPEFEVPPLPTQQRVYVRFDGGAGIAVGNQPPKPIPELDASDFNDLAFPSVNWGPAETQVMKDATMAKLRAIYARYNVDPADANFDDGIKIYSSDDYAATDIPTPFITIYVGGILYDDLLGAADYVDPRNDTTTGMAVVAATTIADMGLNGEFTNGAATPLTLGQAFGTVAAHELGNLLGLRNTSDATDVMQGTYAYIAGDPTVSRTLKTNAVPTSTEQVGSLTPIGTQDAILLLDEIVGVP